MSNILGIEEYTGYIAPESSKPITALYGGVDPGKHGGASLIGSDRRIICCVDTPIIEVPQKGKTRPRLEYDIAGVERLLLSWRQLAAMNDCPLYITIEQFLCTGYNFVDKNGERRTDTGGPGRQAETAMGYMMWKTLFHITRVAWGKKGASHWKRDIGVTSDKKTSFIKARELFPESADLRLFMKPKGRTDVFDGRAESLLIAEWQYRDICQAKEVKSKRVKAA